MRQILPLNPSGYQRHRIHTQERDWAETNCYVDIWIEQEVDIAAELARRVDHTEARLVEYDR